MSQELCRAIDEIISIVDVNGVIREGSDVANRFNELDRTIYVEAQSLSPPLGMPGGVESSIGMTNFPGFRTLNGDIVIQLTEPLRRWKTAMLCMRDLAKQSHITEPNGVVSAERKAKKMPIVDALAELAGEHPEPGKPTGDKPKPATVNERMAGTVMENPEAMGWNSPQWAKHLNCVKSSVVETTTWNKLESARLLAKAERMKDRRRKPKASDNRRD